MIDLRLLIAKKGLLIPPCSAHCFLLRSFYTENESSRQDSFRLPVLPKKSRSSGEPFSFVDYKRVFCEAGKGGDGRISFLRLKNIEFGGPDGGNGGNGGHVIFRADSKITDLSHLNDILKAPEGIDGQESCAHGKNGEHLFVPVPLNTLIKRPSADDLRPSKMTVHELCCDGDLFIAARGGAGGHGNAFYLSNMVRKPLKAEEGGRGEETRYDIEMRIMATAGLVGIPNHTFACNFEGKAKGCCLSIYYSQPQRRNGPIRRLLPIGSSRHPRFGARCTSQRGTWLQFPSAYCALMKW